MKALGTIRCLFALVISGFLLTSCLEEGGCFTGFGERRTEVREFPHFDRVFLEGRLDVTYYRDSAFRVEVSYGHKLMESISTKLEGNTLRISNEVACKGLRDPGKVARIAIYAPEIAYLNNKLAGDLSFHDTLRTGSFTYEQWQSNGEIRLILNTDTAKVFAHVGYTHITVAGRTDVAEIYSVSSGPLEALNLRSRLLWANNSSTRDMTVYASEYLFAFVGRNGGIRYAGDPDVVETDIVGSGSVRPY